MTPGSDISAPDGAAPSRLLRLLAEISSNFVALPSDRMDAAIEETQRLIVETMNIDRSSLWQLGDDHAGMVLTHCWQKPGWPVLPRHLNASLHLPWATRRILSGQSIHYSRLDELPPECQSDFSKFGDPGPKSNITIPLMANGSIFGALAFSALAAERHWTGEETNGVELVARMIGNALGRRRAEQHAELLHNELARASRASVLGELAAGLAHEINQPLAAILGNAQAARRFIAKGDIDSSELLGILDDIIRDNKRASGVISNLRAILDGTPLARQACCINELIAEVRTFTQASLARDQVTLKTNTHEDLIPVRVAKVEIQQVLANLISNAAQAMVETPARLQTITVESGIHGDTVVVSVADNGSGFPPEQSARLFKPFHSTKPTGLGMGLAICRRIIEAHGGTIEARNLDSGGAVFSFTLPLHKPD